MSVRQCGECPGRQVAAVRCVAGRGGAGAPAVPAALGKGLPAAAARLDAGRGGRHASRPATPGAGAVSLPVLRGDPAEQGAAGRARLLSALRPLAAAARRALTA